MNREHRDRAERMVKEHRDRADRMVKEHRDKTHSMDRLTRHNCWARITVKKKIDAEI